MNVKKYKTDVYLWLYPPNVFAEMGKHKIGLVRTVLLDFVPYPGLSLRLKGEYPDQDQDVWSPLLKLAVGPKGAVGLGFNNEIWLINTVHYDVTKRRFEAASYSEMLTLEQLNAVKELMVCYHKFRVYFEIYRAS